MLCKYDKSGGNKARAARECGVFQIMYIIANRTATAYMSLVFGKTSNITSLSLACWYTRYTGTLVDPSVNRHARTSYKPLQLRPS